MPERTQCGCEHYEPVVVVVFERLGPPDEDGGPCVCGHEQDDHQRGGRCRFLPWW